MIAAIAESFPDATHMLCQWHLHKKILMRVTKTFGDAWNQAWFALLNASTETEYYGAEADLLFLEPTDISESLFEYIHKEWLKDDNNKNSSEPGPTTIFISVTKPHLLEKAHIGN